MVTRFTCLGFGSHAKPGLLWSKTDAIPTHLGSGSHAGPKCFGFDTYASPMVLVFGQPNLLRSDTQVIWAQHGCQIQVKVKKTSIPPLKHLMTNEPIKKYINIPVTKALIFSTK
jgi:hypothetical protein